MAEQSRQTSRHVLLDYIPLAGGRLAADALNFVSIVEPIESTSFVGSVHRLRGPAQPAHVIGRRTPLDDCRHMLAPGVERRPLLLCPFVALIDANDTGAAARDVVQNAFGHLEPHAELLQPRCCRSPQIVKLCRQ
jgi:hypothetical protein